jgi:hypothetical protein
VIPDDEDRFVTTAAKAARACKSAAEEKQWNEQFTAFLASIHRWCAVHADRVRAGYVTVGDSSLNVLIGLKEAHYDFDFEDTLVALDMELAERFPQCIAEVLQVPNQEGLTSELSSEALCVYGDSERT